jgi:hypothetical protein
VVLTAPRILLLKDPTRGIDVGTKQEILSPAAQSGGLRRIDRLYSTDYDELIGCCDRVLIFYGGRVVRVLEGRGHHRDQIRGSAFNLPAGETPSPAGRATDERASPAAVPEHRPLCWPFGLFLILYVFYSSLHPRGFTSDLVRPELQRGADAYPARNGANLAVLLGGMRPWSVRAADDAGEFRRLRDGQRVAANRLGMVAAWRGRLAACSTASSVVYGRLQAHCGDLARGGVQRHGAVHPANAGGEVDPT